MYVLLLAAGVTAAALIALSASRGMRGRRRLITQRSGIYLALPSVTTLLVVLPLQLRLSFSDGLSLAGLVLSLAFGMGARAIDRMTSRLRLGVVIPSRVPFHSELRRGLKEALAPVRLEIYDDYLSTNQAVERLSEFLPALRRTLNWRPDYLVLCSPSVQLISTDQVVGLFQEFIRLGGGIVFIDNQPNEQARPKLGAHFGLVTSDVETGARIIADYVHANLDTDDEVLVLCGPPSSAPAKLRNAVLTAVLPNKTTIKVADAGGWTAASALAATRKSYDEFENPRFIVCGNDVMAFGAAQAVREARRSAGRDTPIKGEVIGYDGIARALYAIADPESPVVATICTPPAAYGHEIAAMIFADSRRALWGKSELTDCRIPVSEGQLVTRYNVELVLDG